MVSALLSAQWSGGNHCLLNEDLDASQYIVHHDLRNCLYALGGPALKVDRTDLMAQHNTLRLDSTAAQWHRKASVAGNITLVR